MPDPAMPARRQGPRHARPTRSTPSCDRQAVGPMTNADHDDSALARVADALFCSPLATGSAPDGEQLSNAIHRALAEHDTWDGCIHTVALAHLDDEATATRRLLWCHKVALEAFTHGADLTRGDERSSR